MRALSRAFIIAIGSEMLTPLRVDTNSLFLAGALNGLGVDVVAKAVVGDDRAELASMLRQALARADLVVCCGGLGPTDDDVTRDTVAEVLGRRLHEEAQITERLRLRFVARFGGEMPEINRRQAMVLDGAEVIQNDRGSAPGLWIEADDRLLLLLPGPPGELRPMVESLVGRLATHAGGQVLVRRVLRIAGRIESRTEEALRPLYGHWRAWPVPVDATILAALGQIELHLSARSMSSAAAESAVSRAVDDAAGVLGVDVFSVDGRELEAVVGARLVERGLRVATAESCTGGLIAARLTAVPGSSRYVDRGVVAYSNEAKTALLGVPPGLIARDGAVSEAVAEAMVDGVHEQAGVGAAIAVTGIAGPGGETPGKPVGTVVVAVRLGTTRQVRTFHFQGEREQVRFQASQAALDMLRRLLS